MNDPRTEPLELRAPRGGRVVEIVWGDGHTSRHPNEILRGYCPCAGCQGHSGQIRFVPDQNDVIENIEEVGSYGVSFTWGDGHAGGIYTFRALRAQCVCTDCQPSGALPAVLPRTE